MHIKRAYSSPLVPLSTKPLLSSCSVSTRMLFVQILCLAGSEASLINNLAAVSANNGSDGVAVLIPDRVLTAATNRRCKLTAFLANLTLSALVEHGSRLMLKLRNCDPMTLY